MKRAIFVVTLAIGASTGYAPDAFAHGQGYRAVVVHDGYARGIHQPVWPHWLQAQHEFQRWYLASHYRHLRHPGWHRLYQLYRQDARFHQHQRRIVHRRPWCGCRHH
jgi:hypothetical protein